MAASLSVHSISINYHRRLKSVSLALLLGTLKDLLVHWLNALVGLVVSHDCCNSKHNWVACDIICKSKFLATVIFPCPCCWFSLFINMIIIFVFIYFWFGVYSGFLLLVFGSSARRIWSGCNILYSMQLFSPPS